jgi:hypothetical protein
MVYTYNPRRTEDAVAGGFQVPGQPRIHRKTAGKKN